MTAKTRGWLIGLGALNGVLVIVLLVVILIGAAPGDGVEPPASSGGASAPATTGEGGSQAATGEGGSPAPSTTGSTEDEPAPAAPPEGAVELATFTLPSRNIVCALDEGSATCTIANATFTPPAGEECEWRGQVVTMTADGVALPCPDAASVAAAEDVPTLEYGQTATLGPWACTSSERGIDCFSLVDGTGFTLARAAFTSYGPGRLG